MKLKDVLHRVRKVLKQIASEKFIHQLINDLIRRRDLPGGHLFLARPAVCAI